MTAPDTRLRLAIAAMSLLALAACGSGDDRAADAGATGEAPAASAGGALSATDLEQGIGPVRDLRLTAIDHELAEDGEEAFRTKCSACHRIDDRYVGPRLGTVLDRRRPEFVMNMILNANEMVERHPVVRELLAQFYTPMPVQVTDRAEARAILEYLRSVRIDSTATPTTPPDDAARETGR